MTRARRWPVTSNPMAQAMTGTVGSVKATDHELHLVICETPVAKGRPRLGANGRTYTPKRTRDYEELLQWLFTLNRIKPMSGDLELIVYFYGGRGDVDNLVKCLMDAGNGFLYDDDAQVSRVVAEHHQGAKPPRTVLTLRKRGQGG